MLARRTFLATVLLLPGCALTGPGGRPRVPPDTPAHAIGRHDATVTSLDVSPDGRRLFSAGRDGSVRVWRLPSGEPEAVLQHAPRYLSAWAVKGSPDGRLVASVADDFRVVVWDVETAHPVA